MYDKGSYQDILVALANPREVFWSRRIRKAIAGLGTDDTLLRRFASFLSFLFLFIID